MTFALTPQDVDWALNLVEPTRLAAVEGGILKRADGFAVVALNTKPEIEIVGTRSYGNPDEWEHPFAEHASSKADICWRTGVSSREAIHLKPWLLEDGDSPWEGGIIIDNIIVAYSGGAAEHDEAIAYSIFGWVRSRSLSRAVDQGLWTPTRRLVGE